MHLPPAVQGFLYTHASSGDDRLLGLDLGAESYTAWKEGNDDTDASSVRDQL